MNRTEKLYQGPLRAGGTNLSDEELTRLRIDLSPPASTPIADS